HAAAVTSVPWQLLQLAETSTPGHVKMWFLAGPRLLSVTLLLPRSLLVDSHLPQPQQLEEAIREGVAGGGGAAAAAAGGLQLEVVRAASVTLPGGRRPANVYRVTLPESQYRALAPRLSSALSAPHVAGVYEDRLPATLPAVLALG
ncbi:hypothetical protein Agub_g1685, partial [Astrephomene gubernaculifera]